MTASAGTIIRRDFLPLFRHSPPEVPTFTTYAFFCLWRRWFRLSPIDQDSRLLPSIEVWFFFITSGAVQSFNPAIDFWLGLPLPHQLPKLNIVTPFHSSFRFLLTIPVFIRTFVLTYPQCMDFIRSFSTPVYQVTPFPFGPFVLLICNVLNAPIVFVLS